jgi:hypothetical protein
MHLHLNTQTVESNVGFTGRRKLRSFEIVEVRSRLVGIIVSPEILRHIRTSLF